MSSIFSDKLLICVDNLLSKAGLRLTRSDFETRHATHENREIVDYCSKFSMTDRLALLGLIECVEYIEANHVSGAFVECGVWRGGVVDGGSEEIVVSESKVTERGLDV